jgi:hypothetical protein
MGSDDEAHAAKATKAVKACAIEAIFIPPPS